MKRKLQAQRKFAQGAIIPASHNERVDVPPPTKEPANRSIQQSVVLNEMSPSRLLDLMSLQNLKIRDVRVVVERHQDSFMNSVDLVRKPAKLQRLAMLQRNPRNSIESTASSRRGVLRLRSRTITKPKQNKPINKRAVPKVKKRIVKKQAIVPAAAAVVPPKKKHLTVFPKPNPVASVSGFSSDDDTPLNLINKRKALQRQPKEINQKKKRYFVRKIPETAAICTPPVENDKNITPDETVSEQSKKKVQQNKDVSGNNEPIASTSQSFYNEHMIDMWLGNDIGTPKDNFKVPEVPLARRQRPASSEASWEPSTSAASESTRSGRRRRANSVSSLSSDDDTPLYLINRLEIMQKSKGNNPKIGGYFLRKKTEASTEASVCSGCLASVSTEHKSPEKVVENQLQITEEVVEPPGNASANEEESDDCSKPLIYWSSVSAGSPHKPDDRGPSPCLTEQFNTVEALQNASQKDLDSLCKVCHRCSYVSRLHSCNITGLRLEKGTDGKRRMVGNLNVVIEDPVIDADAPSPSQTPEVANETSADVYNFDETDSVIERPLSRFRNRTLRSSQMRMDQNDIDIIGLIANKPENGAQTFRLQMPNRASLVEPNTENNLLNQNALEHNIENITISTDISLHEGIIDSSDIIKNVNIAANQDIVINGEIAIDEDCASIASIAINGDNAMNQDNAINSDITIHVTQNVAGPSNVTNDIVTTKKVSKKEKPNRAKQKSKKTIGPEKESKVLEAPILFPTEKEFENPLAYIQKITPGASKYGMCKIVPPYPLEPECFFEESARFEVTNQYPGRMFTRWGPATRDFCAIRTHLATEKVEFTRPPLIDSMEVNITKLYHIVQGLGGLSSVLEKKKWHKVAEEMGWEPRPSLTKKIDQIYVKYLLPYDTLNNRERLLIVSRVERAWSKRYKKMLFRARNPLHKQRQQLGETDSSDEEDDEDDRALGEADDCVVRGRPMNLTTFKRIASNAMQLHFSELGREPSLQEVLDKYWQLVLLGSEHLCVNAAAIDTGEQGYGFPKGKGAPYSKHPWNPKVLSNSQGSVLRSLGPVIGVTVPTLHLGMVFSTSCWHRDPHGLPWIEFMHQGPPKIWYGISEEQSDRLRAAVENLCPAFCQNKSIWLASDITMIPPNLLAEHNVTLSKVVQNPGEFIVIFPKAFSSSICSGFTISESVYYAPLSWLTTVQNDFQEVRDSCEPTMFPLEQLLLALAHDARAPQSVLPPAFRALDDIVRAEADHRRALHEMGYEGKLTKLPAKKKNVAVNMREVAECEICRSTLYLSKVVGVSSRSSAHCVQHARLVLGRARAGKAPPPADVSLLYYYSQKALDDAVHRMRQRLLPGAASASTSAASH